MPTITKAIAAAGDDGQWGSLGGFSSSGSPVTVDGTASMWMLFKTIAIPRASTITSATVTLRDVTGITSSQFTIKAEAANSGTLPVDEASMEAKTLTTQSAAWSVASDAPGNDIVSTSFATVVQALVNRAGWVTGNNILLTIQQVSGSGPFGTKDNNTPPSLSITYTPPVGGGIAKRGYL